MIQGHHKVSEGAFESEAVGHRPKVQIQNSDMARRRIDSQVCGGIAVALRVLRLWRDPQRHATRPHHVWHWRRTHSTPPVGRSGLDLRQGAGRLSGTGTSGPRCKGFTTARHGQPHAGTQAGREDYYALKIPKQFDHVLQCGGKHLASLYRFRDVECHACGERGTLQKPAEARS